MKLPIHRPRARRRSGAARGRGRLCVEREGELERTLCVVAAFDDVDCHDLEQVARHGAARVTREQAFGKREYVAVGEYQRKGGEWRGVLPRVHEPLSRDSPHPKWRISSCLAQSAAILATQTGLPTDPARSRLPPLLAHLANRARFRNSSGGRGTRCASGSRLYQPILIFSGGSRQKRSLSCSQ